MAALTEIRAVVVAPAPESAPVPPRSLLTVGQAAEVLGLSRSAVYTLIGSGELRSVRIGSRRRVPVRAVDAYVATLTGAA